MYDKNLKKEALTEINHQVDEELKKSKDDRDYQKIETLLSENYEIMDNSESELDIKARENISKIEQMCKPKNRIKIYQRVAAVAACLVLVFGGNAYTLNAYGENLFSLIVNRSSSGFTVNFNGNNISSEIPDIKDDPYGMIAKCAEYGVYPDTPLYIPDGFELVDFKVSERKKRTTIRFFYQNQDNLILNFDFDVYADVSNIPSYGIPSDECNISAVYVNGVKGITSKEKNSLNGVTDQYTLTYCKGNIVYMIFSDGLEYEECDKITESMTSNLLVGGEKNEETVHNDVIINFVLPVFTDFKLCC